MPAPGHAPSAGLWGWGRLASTQDTSAVLCAFLGIELCQTGDGCAFSSLLTLHLLPGGRSRFLRIRHSLSASCVAWRPRLAAAGLGHRSRPPGPAWLSSKSRNVSRLCRGTVKIMGFWLNGLLPHPFRCPVIFAATPKETVVYLRLHPSRPHLFGETVGRGQHKGPSHPDELYRSRGFTAASTTIEIPPLVHSRVGQRFGLFDMFRLRVVFGPPIGRVQVLTFFTPLCGPKTRACFNFKLSHVSSSVSGGTYASTPSNLCSTLFRKYRLSVGTRATSPGSNLFNIVIRLTCFPPALLPWVNFPIMAQPWSRSSGRQTIDGLPKLHLKAFQDPCLCQERQKGCWRPTFIRKMLSIPPLYHWMSFFFKLSFLDFGKTCAYVCWQSTVDCHSDNSVCRVPEPFRPRSSVGWVTVDLIRRSWVRFPPRSKDFFFTSCGSLISLN